jgi:hypothetical protein
MNITTPAAQHEMIQQLCSGRVLTQYNESIMMAQNDAKTARTKAAVAALRRRAATATVVAEIADAFLRRQADAHVANEALPADPAMLAMI